MKIMNIWIPRQFLFLFLFLFPFLAAADTLVVLNKSEATASLIDLKSGEVVGTVPTGQSPHEAAASPDGKYVLVTNYGTQETPGRSLTLIDVAAKRSIQTIELSDYSRPHGVRWLKDGKTALVTAEANKALLWIDAFEGTVKKVVQTGQEISHMVVASPDGAFAYVANIGSGSVTAIDLAQGKAVQQIETGKGAEGIDMAPDGRELWVTNREADTVSVVDAEKLTVVSTVPSKSFPIRAKFTPDGKHVLVSNARSGDVAVFDSKSRQEIQRIKIPLESADTEGRLFSSRFGNSSVPIGIVVHPDGKRAFVANANADAISILDLENWKVIGKLKAGKEPDGMAYSSVDLTRK